MIRFRAHLLVIAFYALLAAIITFPLILNLSSAFAGFVYGDAYEMAHHVWWFGYALRHGEPLFTQTLLAYPNGIDGALMWAVPLQYFPAWALALVLPLPAALNLQLLLSMALNGWAMWVLARYLVTRVTGQESAFLPALIAGAVYMLFPTMQGHLGAGHAGLIAAWGAPLYAYFLFRLADEPRNLRLIAGTALTFVISTGGHPLQTIYLLLPLTALFGIALVFQRKWRELARITLAAGIGAAAYGVIFLLPSLGSTFGTAAYTDEGGVVRYSADLLAVVTPSFFHPLFGRLDYTHQVLGVNIDEGAAYIGIAAAVLGVIAVIRVRAARWWVLVALVAYVFSLGALLKIFDQPVTVELEGYRSNIPLPFALVAELPVISLARTPGRFNFLTALAVAVLAGYGASWLTKWARPIRYAAVLALIGWIAFEYQLFFPLPTAPAALPGALRDLEGRAVLDLPYENLVTAKQALYLQTAHELPLIAGQLTRRTPVDPAELSLLQETLDPALLDHVGADIVIVHREQDDGAVIETRARENLGDPVYTDAQIAVFARPDLPESAASTSAFAVIDAPADVNHAAVYLYAPQSGWIDAAITLDTLDRAPELRLNGQRIFAWGEDTSAGRADLPVWIPSPGFHTLSLTSANPCPTVIPESLECPPLGSLALDRDFRAEAAPTPVTNEHGIRLLAWRTNYIIGRAFHAYLRWDFDAPISDNDVRFVQVINEAGEIAAQEDRPLGEFQAGDGWQDTVYLYRNGFPPGEYRIYAGWYHLSDDGVLTNYPLTGGSTGNSVLIGVFTVE